MEKKLPHIEFEKQADGYWQYKFLLNGRILVHSEGYSTKKVAYKQCLEFLMQVQCMKEILCEADMLFYAKVSKKFLKDKRKEE
jgi:hypothetical protein